jgi:hypothetical protein
LLVESQSQSKGQSAGSVNFGKIVLAAIERGATTALVRRGAPVEGWLPGSRMFEWPSYDDFHKSGKNIRKRGKDRAASKCFCPR